MKMARGLTGSWGSSTRIPISGGTSLSWADTMLARLTKRGSMAPTVALLVIVLGGAGFMLSRRYLGAASNAVTAASAPAKTSEAPKTASVTAIEVITPSVPPTTTATTPKDDPKPTGVGRTRPAAPPDPDKPHAAPPDGAAPRPSPPDARADDPLAPGDRK